MALFSFYHMRKPRQFEHKPIYWDPHKEALEERVSKIKREMGISLTSRAPLSRVPRICARVWIGERALVIGSIRT